MARYDEIKTHFEKEYRDFIDDYISKSITFEEEQAIRQLRQHGSADYNDMHELVKKMRMLDSTGWLVKKCIFIEEYICKTETNNPPSLTQSLCCIDDTNDSGIQIYCEIIKKEYSDLVRRYCPTKLEETHLGTIHTALPPSLVHKHQQLESISGVDSSGWLHIKKSFAQKKNTKQHNSVNCTADAVIEVLQKVKRNVQDQMFNYILKGK